MGSVRVGSVRVGVYIGRFTEPLSNINKRNSTIRDYVRNGSRTKSYVVLLDTLIAPG